MRGIDSALLTRKRDLVVEKLMNLGAPENEEDLKEGGEKVGFYQRDFGIQEWDWPQGIGLYGLYKLMKDEGREDYRTFLVNWYRDNMAKGLPSKNINTTTPLLTLVNLNEEEKDSEFEKLCLMWANWLMDCLPRTKEGGFQHVTSANGDRQGVRLNDGEMWVDTLFMTVLFLNRIGQRYRRRDWVEESIHQVLLHIKYLCDKKTGLFFHGWSFNERSNFGGIFWCRGNSWFTLGIMEYLEMFEGRMDAGLKRFLVDTYKDQAAALLSLQDQKTGLWHTVLTDPDSYVETSGSAGIAAGIMKGIKSGILGDEYLPCAERAVKGILDKVDADGTVLGVSGGTGMGRDADHYKNILIAPMAYGQSLALLALEEAMRL